MISCRRLDIGVTEGRIQEHTAHKHGGQSATTLLHFLGFYSTMKNSKHGVQENLRRSSNTQMNTPTT